MIKNCLYDDGVFDFKYFMKNNVTDNEIKQAIKDLVKLRVKNGFVAEKNAKATIRNSMAAIGG